MAEMKDRYAAALYEMSRESGALEAHLAQAALLLERIEEENAGQLLENPHIPDATKRQLLEKLFGGRLAKNLMGFLWLTVEKSRESMIIPTLEAFIGLGNRRQGKTTAYVVSAQPLRPEQKDALRALLSDKLGKRVELLAREDPALIGGFYIQVDGRLVDRTVRTRLRRLKESLQRGGFQ